VTAATPQRGKTARRRADSSVDAPRRRPGLDEGKIVGAAVALIRRYGVPALSMRQLARELGIVPMSIYHHIPNKTALLERVVDFVLAPIPTPEPRREIWAEQMKAYTMASWEALASCPGLSEFALQGRATPGSVRLSRHAVAILREAGFDEAMAVLAVTTYHAHLFGLLTGEAFFEGSAGARARKRRKRNGSNGVKARAANPLARLTARAWMEYGVDTAIAGLRYQLQRAPSSAIAKIFEPAG
jgi:AcrR family transcriptional regulator